VRPPHPLQHPVPHPVPVRLPRWRQAEASLAVACWAAASRTAGDRRRRAARHQGEGCWPAGHRRAGVAAPRARHRGADCSRWPLR